MTTGVLQFAVIAILAGIGWQLPMWTPQRRPFGVLVPPDRESLVKAWLRAYRVGLVAFGVVCGLAAVSSAAAGARLVALVSTVVYPVVYCLLHSLAHRALREPKTLSSSAPDGVEWRDDPHWSGVFYANRDNPALLVPRRFTFGLTLNFGHPLAWLFLVLLLAIPLVTTLLVAFAPDL